MCWPRESLESNTTVKQVIRKISYWKCSDRSVSDWNKAELGRVKWSWNNPEVEAFSEPKSMLLSCFHLSYNFRSQASNLKPQLNGKTLRVTFERSLKVIFIKNCTSSDLKLSNDYSHLRSMQTPIFTKLLLFYFACFFYRVAPAIPVWKRTINYVLHACDVAQNCILNCLRIFRMFRSIFEEWKWKMCKKWISVSVLACKFFRFQRKYSLHTFHCFMTVSWLKKIFTPWFTALITIRWCR